MTRMTRTRTSQPLAQAGLAPQQGPLTLIRGVAGLQTTGGPSPRLASPPSEDPCPGQLYPPEGTPTPMGAWPACKSPTAPCPPAGTPHPIGGMAGLQTAQSSSPSLALFPSRDPHPNGGVAGLKTTHGPSPRLALPPTNMDPPPGYGAPIMVGQPVPTHTPGLYSFIIEG
uniref:Uncharacterized protein n=1 Tax=Myotis myotis TaxID=51298 RepID=A0A7J8AMK8_MYOMY|nr:hypothetical protein mMyoMyo1_008137 [Myotis myotis]